jgi:glucose/arabinose dehydrogenase
MAVRCNKPGQLQKDGKRYATGIRSIVGMEWNFQDGNLFALSMDAMISSARGPIYILLGKAHCFLRKNSSV